MFFKSFKLFGLVVLMFLMGCGSVEDGVSNKVVDVNGEVIEGAVVLYGEEIFMTDEDGEFDLVDGEVVVLAEGYESFEGSLSEDGVVVLEVRPYQSVLGYIYDENGPLEEAVVVYLDPNSFEPLGFMPADEGFVYFPGIAESNSTFLVLSDGYEVGVVSMDIDGEEDVFALRMEKMDGSVAFDGGGGFFETAYAQGSQREYDRIKLYFEMAAALSQGAVIVQPFYVSPTTFNTLDHAYKTYLGQSNIDQLKQEIDLLPNQAGGKDFERVIAFFKMEIDAGVGHSDINIGEIDLTSPLFSNPLYQTNNVVWEPIVNSTAIDTRRGVINYTAPIPDRQIALMGSIDNVSINTDTGILFIDNGDSSVSNVLISVKLVSSVNNSLDSGMYNITVDQIVKSMFDSDVSGGGEIHIFISQSEFDAAGVRIKFEHGGEITVDEDEDEGGEVIYYIVGEVPPPGETHPSLGFAYESFLWCLYQVNLKYSEVVAECMDIFGDPGGDAALGYEIGKCMNEDPGYKEDARQCGVIWGY